MDGATLTGSDFSLIEVSPVAASLGAEVRGVDLARPLEPAVLAEIRRAFLKHQAIVFRGQELEVEAFKAFARHFSAIHEDRFIRGMEGHPEIMVLAKDRHEKLNFGAMWHHDVSFLPQPTLGSLLYAREVPPYGGDTLFSSMYAAYDALSDGMKAMLAPLRAVHLAAPGYGAEIVRQRFTEDRTIKAKDIKPEDASLVSVHPVVRTHPETGRKALFVNCFYTSHFEGMTVEESRPLLEYLCTHAGRPEFTFRHRWQVDDLLFFDNRCVQHYALNDYHGFRRVLHRITLEGDTPI